LGQPVVGRKQDNWASVSSQTRAKPGPKSRYEVNYVDELARGC